jgi:hypothetical protein
MHSSSNDVEFVTRIHLPYSEGGTNHAFLLTTLSVTQLKAEQGIQAGR